MPTYEYRCAQGHTFERFEKISAEPTSHCPECGAEARRVISGGAGLVFKGSGFYITDYGKDGKGPPKDTSSKPSTPKKDAGTGGSDSSGGGSSSGGTSSSSSSSDTSSASGD